MRISDWSSDVCSSDLWSDNPALHALTWALGRWENGKRTVGIGAPVANIRVSDFVEAANIADANGWTMGGVAWRSEEHTSELQSLMRISYAVFCLKKKTTLTPTAYTYQNVIHIISILGNYQT